MLIVPTASELTANALSLSVGESITAEWFDRPQL